MVRIPEVEDYIAYMAAHPGWINADRRALMEKVVRPTLMREDVTFDRVNNGYQTIWWNLAGVDFFYNLYNITGDIPSGTYRTHLYWDGMWVNDSTFKVQ